MVLMELGVAKGLPQVAAWVMLIWRADAKKDSPDCRGEPSKNGGLPVSIPSMIAQSEYDEFR